MDDSEDLIVIVKKIHPLGGPPDWIWSVLLSTNQGVVVTGNSTNVRQVPGTSYLVVFQLSKGMHAEPLEKQDKWAYVQTADAKKGWIAEFLVWGE